MLLYLEKAVAAAARTLVFEPNDPIMWSQFKSIVTPFFTSVQARRGLVDFKVICDATTNTPATIDANEMMAILLVKPTKTAEFLVLNFTLTSQSASFSSIKGF
jgi:phage tail sheath protein FI